MHSKAQQPSSKKLRYIQRLLRNLRRINQFFKLTKPEEPKAQLEKSILDLQELLCQRRQELAKAHDILQRIQWLASKDMKVASAAQPEIEQQTTLVETLQQELVDLDNKISKARLQKNLLELQELSNQAIKPLKTLEACWQNCETLTNAEVAIQLVELEIQFSEMQYSLSELRGVIAQIVAAQKRAKLHYDSAQNQRNEEIAQLLLTTLNHLTTSKDILNEQLLTWERRISELNTKHQILRIQAERARGSNAR